MSRLHKWWLAHIARPDPAQTFLPAIDGLRFVAIALVVLYHVQGYVSSRAGLPVHGGDGLHQWLVHGSFGVPLFFAISGFIIASQWFAGRPPSLARYLLRRITRLEPPYIVSMLLIFGLKVAVLGVAFSELMPHLMISLVYLHGPIFGTHSEVNGVAWSLEVEWQFYLLAPLILTAALRLQPSQATWVLAGLVFLGGIVHGLADSLAPRIALSVLQYFGFFLAGVWVAQQHTATARSATAFDAAALTAAVAIGAALHLGGLASAVLPLLTAAFLASSLRSKWWSALLSWWPIHGIGAMCYTIYLYHFFIVSGIGRVWPHDSFGPSSIDLVIFAAFTFPLVVVVCTVPYVLIERPFMVWRPGVTRLRDALSWMRR